MRQVYIVSLIGLLPLLMIGCGSQNPEASNSTETLPPVLPKVAASPNPSPGATANGGANKVAQGNSGLIPSTNPEVRTKAVAAGVRKDPFRSLAVSPEIGLSKEAIQAAIDKANEPKLPSGSSGSLPSSSGLGSGHSGHPKTGAASSHSTQQNPGNGKLNQTPKAPPPPPSTELAKAVEVSGVVQLGPSIVAIVRAPEEPTSRNVQVGERLANGKVLVKRISVGIAGNPTVVLEENGVEVIKTLNNTPSLMG